MSLLVPVILVEHGMRRNFIVLASTEEVLEPRDERQRDDDCNEIVALPTLHGSLGETFEDVRAAQRSRAFGRPTERHDESVGDAVALSAIGSVVVDSHYSVQAIARLVTREATTLGFADANLVGGIAAFLLVPIALFFPNRKSPRLAAPKETSHDVSSSKT